MASVTIVTPRSDQVDRNASDALVIEHLRLADALARRYAGRGLEFDDLAQVARLALVKAAHRFDTSLGESFAAYATVCISGEIKRHFRDFGWLVRPPRRLQELVGQRRHAESELNLALSRRPTATELSAAMGITEPELRRVEATGGSFRGSSLDALETQDTGLGARHEHDEKAVRLIVERDWLDTALAGLTDRELDVLRLRFTHDMTQAQIATRIGLSQIQVSRILRATLARLRSTMTASLQAS